MPAVDLELRGFRALKAEDGLLLVSHNEERARALAAIAGEKFLAQAADDTPLLGTGVLAFVDENVIEPAVELVKHPGRGIAAFQEPQCFRNQIVVVENAAFAFEMRILRMRGRGDGERGA